MINVAWMRVPFLFLLFLTHCAVNAQSGFATLVSYESILSEAKLQNKLMFLIVHQRDESFKPLKTSVSKKTREYIDEKFVSGAVQVEGEDINHPLNKAFRLTAPVNLFTDNDGYPILRYNLPIKDEKTLLQLADSAYTLAKGETLGKLMMQYKKGKRSGGILRKIITQYQDFDYYADQKILSEYLGQLTIQELNNFETVVFLMKSGPVYSSNIYNLTRTNGKMVDSLYSYLPLPTRMDINGRIIQQTFRQALENANYSQAIDLKQFIRGCWSPNYLRAQIGGDYYPMEYQRLVRDTVEYIASARNYYNVNYYRVSPDSIARVDYAVGQKITVFPFRNLLNRVQTIEFDKWFEKYRAHYTEEQARYLSYGARQILAFAPDNTDALYDAIRWQRKAIEQQPGIGQHHHTLAMLLYKVGFAAQAEGELLRAKDLYKPNKIKYREMETLLKQMKPKQL